MTGQESHQRQGFLFIAKFLGFLALFFLSVALRPINDRFVEPFTGLVARTAAALCRILGEPAEVQGTLLRSPRFAVSIRNGCNGLETVLVFSAAVLAFPARWRTRFLGLAAGILAIQAANQIRVVALFFSGIYFPKLFEKSHTVFWPAAIILFGMVLFLLWAEYCARSKRTPQPST